MKIRTLDRHSLAVALAFGIVTALAGCGSKQEPTATAPPATAPAADPAPAPTAAPAAAPTPVAASDVTQSWTPEALEDLLAPIALYPDPVLSQVLIAATNPQEVLDAGNWLIANEGLKGSALDDGAAKAGFTPPLRALVQFPQTIDMMCMELGWTTELGEAFVADQAGVLAAVQRLRQQAKDVGNLQSSPAMKVETVTQEGQEVIVLKPPKPDVVYVPTYDPQAVYAPAPAAAAPVATTTTPVEDKTKYSTGNMITTGLLAFGAGILVNEIFDDDDDDYRSGYYYPNYGYGGMPYYPPYPYRPTYGNGYYPSNGYNRPPNYNNGFQNNGNIIITNPGGGNGGYWDRYPNNRPGSSQLGGGNNYKQPRKVSSPITAARPNRPELQQLNQRQPRPMPADYKRPDPTASAANWKGQSSYAGTNKRPASAQSPQDRINNAQPGYSRPAPTNKASAQRPAPKVQGSYAGKDKANRPSPGGTPGTRDLQRPQPSTRDVQRPAPSTRDLPKAPQKPAMKPSTRPAPKPVPGGDRGYNTRDMQRPTPSAKPMPANRPSPSAQPSRQNKGTAMSGSRDRGSADRAASQRGKQSMPQGARSKGGGGKKQAR